MKRNILLPPPLVIATPIELFCDRSGNLWINGSNVLQKFDGVNWTTFVPQLWGFPFEWANGLTEDRYGNVWGYCGGGIAYPEQVNMMD